MAINLYNMGTIERTRVIRPSSRKDKSALLYLSLPISLSQKEGVPNKQLALVLSKISIIFSCENIGISIISNPKL